MSTTKVITGHGVPVPDFIEHDLFMTTAELHEMAPKAARSHSDILTIFRKVLSELTGAGVLEQGKYTWFGPGLEVVAKHIRYEDSQGRSRPAIRFGSYMCLAVGMRVTRAETKKALLDALSLHPLVCGTRIAITSSLTDD